MTLQPMISPDLLTILCCPETHQGLTLADPALVDAINQQITAGTMCNRGGQPVKEQLDGGLVRADRQWLYPVRQGIPVMLIDEALPLPIRK
jgi:uncharacterized protein YbaR (Trm112 family)